MTRFVMWHIITVRGQGMDLFRPQLRYGDGAQYTYNCALRFDYADAVEAAIEAKAHLETYTPERLASWACQILDNAPTALDRRPERQVMLTNAAQLTEWAEELLGKPERRGVAS